MDLSYMTTQTELESIKFHRDQRVCLEKHVFSTLYVTDPLFAILELDDYVKLLDEGLAQSDECPIGLVIKKVWMIGIPSNSLPLAKAPWLLKILVLLA